MCQTKHIVFVLILLLSAYSTAAVGQTIPRATPQEESRLIAVLQSEAPHKDTVDACRGLAVVGTKRAVPALAALLGDEKLSHMARYGLEPIPDPSVDDALREALGKLKGPMLAGVASSVGVRRDAKAVPILAKTLKDSHADVVTASARALGRIGTADAAIALRQRLASAPDSLRPAVADACLICAETLRRKGKASEAMVLYASVRQADLPSHFRVAAMQGTLQTREDSSGD